MKLTKTMTMFGLVGFALLPGAGGAQAVGSSFREARCVTTTVADVIPPCWTTTTEAPPTTPAPTTTVAEETTVTTMPETTPAPETTGAEATVVATIPTTPAIAAAAAATLAPETSAASLTPSVLAAELTLPATGADHPLHQYGPLGAGFLIAGFVALLATHRPRRSARS